MTDPNAERRRTRKERNSGFSKAKPANQLMEMCGSLQEDTGISLESIWEYVVRDNTALLSPKDETKLKKAVGGDGGLNALRKQAVDAGYPAPVV